MSTESPSIEVTAPSENSEALRKLLHIGFGFGAIFLKWLSTPAAAAIAASAFLFNWLILPRVGGRAISRSHRGYDGGILLYPLAVLAMILAFPQNPEIAGVGWVILAFSDGTATLVGRNFGVRRIPWNPDKSIMGSLAFIEIGIPAAYAISLVLDQRSSPFPRFLVISVIVIACAVVESLPLRIDDNLTIPLTSSFLMFVLLKFTGWPSLSLGGETGMWLVANAGLAVAGYLTRSVTVSGMIGGFLLGAVLILFGGWELYLVLLAFFILGSLVTRLGYGTKQELGLAQEKSGRRGLSHAFANVGVAAIAAFLIGCTSLRADFLWLAAAAALATATGDTISSEIGQWIGRRAFLPLTFRRVNVGTDGAISLEGTAAGLIGGFLVSVMAVLLFARRFGEGSTDVLRLARHGDSWKLIGAMTAAAFVGGYVESVMGSRNRNRERPIPGSVLNFLNTLIGALVFLAIVSWIAPGPQ